MDLKELHISDKDSKRHPWEEIRAEVIIDILTKEFPELIKKAISVFDIGCGDTYLIEKLSIKFPEWKFFAIDNAFTNQELEYLKSKYKASPISVFNSIENACQEGGRAELVLLLDVLEHIEKDIDFLNDLKSQPFVQDETGFLITVPAFKHLFSSHDVFLGHYRRYTNKSLKKTILSAGLKPVELGYFFSSLLIPRLFQAAYEKIAPAASSKGVAEWKGNRITSFIFKNILRFDYFTTYLLKKGGVKLPGLSNYAICKKPV